ncbi:MAG: ABC transporter permease subunit [Acidimicrobiales bacterium]
MTTAPISAAPARRPTGVAAPRDRMSGLVRSEWTKLTSVRSTLWSYGIAAVLAVGLAALATAETKAHWATMAPPERLTFDPTSTSLVGVFFAQLVIGVLGVLVVSAEYSTGTIRATFSAAPGRLRVLAAKTAVFAVASLVVAEVLAFVSFFLGQALLTAPATHATLGQPGVLRAVVGGGLYLCVLGVIGLALGLMIRHGAGAIAAFVGVLLVLPIIVQALPSSIGQPIRRFLPAMIGNKMITVTRSFTAPNGAHFVNGAAGFAPWVGFAILCAYAVGLLIVGGILLVRRDA